MVFGGAFGFIFIAFISFFCIIWLIIRSLLIYLKCSVGLSGLENLDIKHNLFRLRIKYIHFLSLFSIFILRLPLQLKRNRKKDWQRKLYLLKYVSIRINQLQIEYGDRNISFQQITLHPSVKSNNTRNISISTNLTEIEEIIMRRI
ncbi:unnamed protein product [Rotaria sordida]|uniref:Uncharacterized protein n=1 Tax=Rotaria sordida TaxID=392033 RepID=A0A815P8Q4_9BILA|nr:unnamed protein product [Rotaria sordida]